MKTTNRFIVMAVLFSCSLLAGQTGFAQFDLAGVKGTGSASTQGDAELMRMKMTIEAKGVDFKSAIEAMAKKKKKATIQLEKLGAVDDSIEFNEATGDGEGDTSQMMQMMTRQLGNDPRMAKMLEVKPPVSIKANLTAAWQVEGSGDELLIACDELKKKITEADVGQTKVKIELSAEQEELAEEMAEMMNNYGGSQAKEPGAPSFYFVRTVSPEDHDQLIGEAYAKAKSKAERLAKATSLELGKLHSVTSTSDTAAQMAQMYSRYGGYDSATPQGGETENGSFEAVAQSPTSIKYEVSIALAYEIKQ